MTKFTYPAYCQLIREGKIEEAVGAYKQAHNVFIANGDGRYSEENTIATVSPRE